MKTARVGLLTSAATFIAVGTIILLHGMGLVSYSILKYLWPILLIAFGMELVVGQVTGRGRVNAWSAVLIGAVAVVALGQLAFYGWIQRHFGLC